MTHGLVLIGMAALALLTLVGAEWINDKAGHPEPRDGRSYAAVVFAVVFFVMGVVKMIQAI